MTALLLPIISIFIMGIIIESFNAFFYKNEDNSETDQRLVDEGIPLVFDTPFSSIHQLWFRLPFLLRLFLLIISIIIFYYISASVDIMIYTLFGFLFFAIVIAFIYAIFSMILNYKVKIAKLDVYFLTKQTLIDQDISKSIKQIAPDPIS
ncbi:MAG: hypothetical protein HQK75_11705 [Candidatus Magnetomorum sp.]|nr:hypothetical protein [Candidatus Magnetomorum sp.]